MTAPDDGDVAVGRLAGAFGVRGWVRVQSFTQPLDGIVRYQPWLVERQGERREVRVLANQHDGGRLRVRLEGIDDRDAAALMTGATVYIRRSQLEPTAPDEYYWADLIGCGVSNAAGVHLGTVERLMETGANDVLVITPADAERSQPHLVPFVQGQYVLAVDLDARQIRVDWDESF